MNNFDEAIANIILVEHHHLKGRYGTLRLKHHIQQKYGLVLNHKLIRRYKQSLNLKVKVRKRKPPFLKQFIEKSPLKKAPYLMEGNFKSTKPLEKLSTDVSYIPCTDGLLYLSAVKDLFNNEIIAYALSEKNDINLVIETFKSLPLASSHHSIINSDQGPLYYSGLYIEMVEKMGYQRSMSGKGLCWQNCPIENWFSQLKQECLRIEGPLTKDKTKKIIKRYVKWYNTQRIQKNLAYTSPTKYKSVFYLLST